jgi:nucleoid-associated protein YgaU
VRKSFVLAIALSMSISFALSIGGRLAHAQSLDDAIDAELDEVSSGNSPSTDAKASKPSSALDDIQLDDSSPAPPVQTAKAPAAPAADPGPSPGLVEDELKLDDEPLPKEAVAPKAEEPKAQEPTTDLKTELAPQPSQEAPIVEPVTNVQPAPVVADEPPPQVKKLSGVEMDGGNAAYEKRLSQYSRGYKQVPDVNWDEIIGDRRQENYRLQKGDTLWDISGTFFGDGFFWAKLWSENGVIGNPHMILKGKGIRFIAGNESDAPAIGVVDIQQNNEVVLSNPFHDAESDRPTYREEVQTEVTPEEIESGVVLETDELIPAPELPPAKKRVALLKQLPKSFVDNHVVGDVDYDASGLKGAPAIRAHIAPTIFVNSFILDGQPNEIGKVDEIELQERFAAVGQGVFVRANKDLEIGARVTFVRRRDQARGTPGPVVDVLGVGAVDGVVKENSNTYHVTVTTTLFPVEKGALVLAEPPPHVVVSTEGRHSEKHVRVVGGEFEESRKVMGAPSIIYLSGGSESGLQPGDILGLEAKRGTRRDTKYGEYLHSIAVIKIADVRQKVATAVVVSSTEGIMVGDYTSGQLPEDLPTLRAESADEAMTAFGRREPVEIK